MALVLPGRKVAHGSEVADMIAAGRIAAQLALHDRSWRRGRAVRLPASLIPGIEPLPPPR